MIFSEYLTRRLGQGIKKKVLTVLNFCSDKNFQFYLNKWLLSTLEVWLNFSTLFWITSKIISKFKLFGPFREIQVFYHNLVSVRITKQL